MTWDGTAGLLAAAMGCAVLAAWLTGVLVHLRLARAGRSGGRRTFRVALPMAAGRAETEVASSLAASGHYLLSFTGRMEQALMAVIQSPGSGSAQPLARLFLRVDDHRDGRARVQVRLDFSGLIERSRRAISLVLIAVWPAWIAAVAAFIAVTLARADGPHPWLALHGIHGTYPLFAVLVLLSRYHRRRRRIGDAVSAALRASLHGGTRS